MFNLGSSYFHVALTTLRHLLTVSMLPVLVDLVNKDYLSIRVIGIEADGRTAQTRLDVDVEHSLLVSGDDGVQDPATYPRILVGRLDDGKCAVGCHGDVPRDRVAGTSEDR